MQAIFCKIAQSLLSGRDLAVATIIRDDGSTPRKSGSRMIVLPDGGTIGTIGGGGVEGDVVQRAMHCLQTQTAEIAFYDLGQSAAMHSLDVICGGKLQILIESVPVNSENITLYNAAQAEITNCRPFVWMTRVAHAGGKLLVAHGIRKADHEYVGPPQLQPEIQALVETDRWDAKGSFIVENQGHSYVLETILPLHAIFLFGAGHVSRDIAALSARAGFRIIVFDDRAEFADAERFPDADKICVCPEYAEVFKGFDTQPGDYVVIVTRGHRFDKDVLAQALQTQAGYIGMIGSRKKKDSIYQALIEQGVPPSALEQVYCPIGLSIGAETPYEIAVSVVAQLIQHRAKRRQNA